MAANLGHEALKPGNTEIKRRLETTQTPVFSGSTAHLIEPCAVDRSPIEQPPCFMSESGPE